MDTTWYAVDADGVVARFESGEAGAVPLDAPIGFGEADPTIDELELDAIRLARAATVKMLEDVGTSPVHAPTYSPMRVIAVVDWERAAHGYRDAATVLEAVLDAFAAYEPYVLRDAPPVLVGTAKKLPRADLERLSKRPGVRAVLGRYDLRELLSDRDPGDPMLAYGNQDYDSPGSYEREHNPATPLRLEDLPEPVRAALEPMKLPVRFTDSPSLQLADHMSDDQAAIYGDTTLLGEHKPRPPSPIDRPADTWAVWRRHHGRQLLFVMVFLAVVGLIVLLRR